MRQIRSFVIAGMLGLLTLPAGGAGRGNGAPQSAHASSGSTTASHVAIQSPKPPKTPSVGGAAPAPVVVHKRAAVSTAAGAPGAPAAEVADDDPVLDSVPVSDSPTGYVSQATTFEARYWSYDEIEGRSNRSNSSGALNAGTDTSETGTPTISDTLWQRIDAASSHAQTVLSTQPEYRAAVARSASAEQKLAALRAGGKQDSDQLRLAAQKASEARQETVQMQMSALEADPNFSAALTRNEPAAVVGE
jgi:hypothetical protein